LYFSLKNGKICTIEDAFCAHLDWIRNRKEINKMLTGKQKSYLRSLAQTEKTPFQIGKDGFTENLLTTVQDYLTKNELLKVSLLDIASITMEEAAQYFEQNRIEVVQLIGKTIVLYRRNPKKKDGIRLPR